MVLPSSTHLFLGLVLHDLYKIENVNNNLRTNFGTITNTVLRVSPADP